MRHIIFIISLFVLSAFSIYSQTEPASYFRDTISSNSIIIDRMDSIKATVDSVKAEILLVTENTRGEELFNIDIDWYNFVFAFLAFFVACFSAVYDFRGFQESKRTADNVM